MKPIQAALASTDGYITSFKRNTVEGWWEIEIGLPQAWVFDENDKIKCEVLAEAEMGKLIKISPKNSKVVIDDLILFVEIIIATNQRIAEKEKQFTDKMAEMKGMLEQEAKKFYKELDELKETSFKKVGENFVKGLQTTEKKPRKPRTPKPKVTDGEVTNTTPISTTTGKSDLLELDTSEESKK
jgi:hypothetical protein